MDNGLIFDNFLSAVEWAEDNIVRGSYDYG